MDAPVIPASHSIATLGVLTFCSNTVCNVLNCPKTSCNHNQILIFVKPCHNLRITSNYSEKNELFHATFYIVKSLIYLVRCFIKLTNDPTDLQHLANSLQYANLCVYRSQCPSSLMWQRVLRGCSLFRCAKSVLTVSTLIYSVIKYAQLD